MANEVDNLQTDDAQEVSTLEEAADLSGTTESIDSNLEETPEELLEESVSNEEEVEEEAPHIQIAVLRDFCLRVHGADCARCSLACPHEAITFAEDGRPVVNEEACTYCGICLGICDTFSSVRVTLNDLYQRFHRIVEREEQPVITCSDNLFPGFKPAANVVVLPCLASLSPEFWMLLLAEDIPTSIAVDFAYCSTCLRAGEMGEMLYGHAIKTAEEITDRKVGYLKEIPEKESLFGSFTSTDDSERRGIFSNIVSDVSDIASGKRHLRNSKVVQNFMEQREKARAQARLNLSEGITFSDFVPQGATRKTMWPKRRILLKALEYDSSIASRLAAVVSQTDANRCAMHGKCAHVCPTGARSISSKEGQLEFDERFCTGCGLCVDACPEKAVQLIETTAEVFLTKPESAEKEHAEEPPPSNV